jgi:Holliday junction resolvase
VKRINSRAKGKAGELELAAFLRDRGLVARRGQQFKGGSDSPDVVCDDLAHMHIECKRVEAGNPYKWLAQARRDAAGKLPVVAHRRSRHEWLAILSLNDLLELLGHTEW